MPTKRTHGRFAAFAGICAVASLALAACTSADPGASNGDENIVIRIAMGSSGDAVDSQWDVLADRYHEKYPNRTVEPVIQEDDIYQTTGLPTLLSSRERPTPTLNGRARACAATSPTAMATTFRPR